MAESTLSLTRNDLREAVGLKLGYGLDTSGWQPEQISRIDICVRDGMGSFYLPLVQDKKEIYEWSFLRLTAQIDLVSGQANDDLPEDCDGAIDGFVVIAGDATATVIPVIPVRELLKLRATVESGIPKYAAIRIKSTDPTTAVSQRYEVLWFPTPDSSTDDVQFEYPVRVDTIGTTNTSNLMTRLTVRLTSSVWQRPLSTTGGTSRLRQIRRGTSTSPHTGRGTGLSGRFPDTCSASGI